MITQRTMLKEQIIELEAKLKNAALYADAFKQIRLHKKLEILKSTLLNID